MYSSSSDSLVVTEETIGKMRSVAQSVRRDKWTIKNRRHAAKQGIAYTDL